MSTFEATASLVSLLFIALHKSVWPIHLSSRLPSAATENSYQKVNFPLKLGRLIWGDFMAQDADLGELNNNKFSLILDFVCQI